jgi:hypothetical protein
VHYRAGGVVDTVTGAAAAMPGSAGGRPHVWASTLLDEITELGYANG